MIIKNVVLGIAIVILTISVVAYGINVFYDSPEYEDYCGELRDVFQVDNQIECEAEGGYWNTEIKPIREVQNGWCDTNYECGEEYDIANEVYSRNLFVIALIVGIVILVVGGFLFSLEAVGAGLMGGGVGVILYGVGAYWRHSGDVLRFGLSLLGLVAVIYLTYWLNKKGSKKK